MWCTSCHEIFVRVFPTEYENVLYTNNSILCDNCLNAFRQSCGACSDKYFYSVESNESTNLSQLNFTNFNHFEDISFHNCINPVKGEVNGNQVNKCKWNKHKQFFDICDVNKTQNESNVAFRNNSSEPKYNNQFSYLNKKNLQESTNLVNQEQQMENTPIPFKSKIKQNQTRQTEQEDGIQEFYRRPMSEIHIDSKQASDLTFESVQNRTVENELNTSKLNMYKPKLSTSLSPFSKTSTDLKVDQLEHEKTGTHDPCASKHDAFTNAYNGPQDKGTSTHSYPQLNTWKFLNPSVKSKNFQSNHISTLPNKNCDSKFPTKTEFEKHKLSDQNLIETEKQFLKNVRICSEKTGCIHKCPNNNEKIPNFIDKNLDLNKSNADSELQEQDIKQYSLDSGNFCVKNFINFLKSRPDMTLEEVQDFVDKLNEENEKLNNANKSIPVGRIGDGHDESKENSEQLSDDSVIIANAWRSNFSQTADNAADETYTEPSKQYKPVKQLFSSTNEQSDCKRKENQVFSILEMKISKEPSVCPITDCNANIFLSEFAKHIKYEHAKVPIERVHLGKNKNIFLDLKTDKLGVNRCHFMLLVCNKIKDFGSEEFKNYLPVLFLSRKINLYELMAIENDNTKRLTNDCSEEYLAIWLIGIMPVEIELNYCISTWPRHSKIPRCHITRSGKLPSIRSVKDVKGLYKCGQLTVLSQLQCDQLSNNGQNMIEFQVMFH